MAAKAASAFCTVWYQTLYQPVKLVKMSRHCPHQEVEVLDETEGVDFGGYLLKEGRLTVPDAPGFGMDLIWGQELYTVKI